MGRSLNICWALLWISLQADRLRAEDARQLSLSEFIYDWSAMGSGCRGQLRSLDKTPGSVRFKLTPPTGSLPNRYQLQFVLEKFRLESPVPKDQGRTNLEFARDCAIRVALNPRPGKKIKFVEAHSAYTISKSKDTEMATMAGLTLGMAQLSTVRMDFPKSDSFVDQRRELSLIPGPIPENTMPETKCGQSKLLGLDLLLYINRHHELSKNRMALDKDQRVRILVDLEDCE